MYSVVGGEDAICAKVSLITRGIIPLVSGDWASRGTVAEQGAHFL
jgi:uncharacterized protein YsxB (DUF464 family)